jgi:hypothetical protein
MVVLFKKGLIDNPNNYRGISLEAHVLKIVTAVIKRRLEIVVDLLVGDYQSGFRGGRGTPECILTYDLLSERLRAKGDKLFTAFVEFEKAFDCVNWTVLFHVLRIAGVPGAMVDVISGLYAQCSFRVRLDGGALSGPIKPVVGVRQGCLLSPMLFIIFMEFVLKLMMRLPVEGAIRIQALVLELLGYADDLALFSTQREGLQKRLDQLEGAFSAAGMKISIEKTEILVQNASEEGQIFLHGTKLKEVEQFLYLGGVQSTDGTSTWAVQQRISKASKAFWQLRKLWKSSLKLKVKGLMYTSLIRSILLYGAGT